MNRSVFYAFSTLVEFGLMHLFNSWLDTIRSDDQFFISRKQFNFWYYRLLITLKNYSNMQANISYWNLMFAISEEGKKFINYKFTLENESLKSWTNLYFFVCWFTQLEDQCSMGEVCFCSTHCRISFVMYWKQNLHLKFKFISRSA